MENELLKLKESIIKISYAFLKMKKNEEEIINTNYWDNRI